MVPSTSPVHPVDPALQASIAHISNQFAIEGDFIDLTGDQFPRETRIIFADGAPMTTAQAQAYAISAGDTRQRFERLKARFVARISPRN